MKEKQKGKVDKVNKYKKKYIGKKEARIECIKVQEKHLNKANNEMKIKKGNEKWMKYEKVKKPQKTVGEKKKN